MDLSVQKTAENIWAIEQRGVRAFLLVGTDSAVLVDTCFGGAIRSVCEAVTDMPITLLTTTPAVIRSFLCSICTAQNSQNTKGAARDLLELVQQVAEKKVAFISKKEALDTSVIILRRYHTPTHIMI